FSDLLELVDHRDDQAAKVAIEEALKLGLAVRSLGRDVLVLHLAEQALDPPLELTLELGAIDDEQHRRVLEALFVLKDEARRGEQREGLARALGVPDEATRLLRVGAAVDDSVDGALLVLPQHRLPGLAVLDVEENPVL